MTSRLALVTLLVATLPSLAFAESDVAATVDAAATDAQSLTGRTHDFILPTGELVPRGRAEVSVHELGLFSTAAYGITDQLELSVGMPVIPVFAQIHARVGLMPRSSPLKVVVGAGVLVGLVSDSDGAIFETSGTVAWQSERVNVHGTISLFKVPDEDAAFGFLGAGVALRLAAHLAATFDLVRVSAREYRCDDFDGYAGCFDATSRMLVGMKILGTSFDTDLGLLFPVTDQHDDMPVVPAVSMTYRY